MRVSRFITDHISLVVVALMLPMALAYWPFKIDDAYISFVYAKNLVQGNGLTYNGMVVEGYSNFIWTILIAPFIWLRADPFLTARVISLVSAGLALFVTEKLNRQLHPGISVGANFLSLAVVALSAPFAAWTMGGLETVFFSLWIILCVYWEVRFGRWLPFVACLVSALTRPEGVMLFAVVLFHRVIFRKEPIKRTFLYSLLFILPYSVFLLWRYSYYGYLVPNTAFIKLAPGLQTSISGLIWLLSYFQLRPVFTLLLLTGLISLLASKLLLDRKWSLVILVIGAFVFFILYSGPDWMPHHRFLAPVVLLFCPFIGRLLSIIKQKPYQFVVTVLTLSAIAMEVVIAVLFFIPASPKLGNDTDGLVRGGLWIRENTQPDDVIAVTDAGALAYYSERQVIDILGLNNEHIAHSPDKSDHDYVLNLRPKILQLRLEFSPTGELTPERNQDAAFEIYRRTDFLKWYQLYWEGAKEPFFPFLFVLNPD